MRVAHPIVALAVATAALAACDRPNANTAYNNSGRSAATAPAAGSPPATSAPATSDTSSPNVASTAATPPAGAAGGASGAVNETVTSTKILAAIASDSGLKDANINVTTSNGVVTLGGTANSQDQVALASGIAQRQEGVSRVESNIEVR
jgi:osmotically-inducible protein OsmY